MDNSGQCERWCPKCKKETDQQFSVLDKDNKTIKILYNCLKNCGFEEIVKKNRS